MKNKTRIRIDADTENDGRVVDTGYIISQSKTHALVHADKLRADIRVRLDEIREEKPAHTPTPWEVDSVDPRFILANGNSIAEIDKSEDAAFIVKAVNCHKILLALVKKMYDGNEVTSLSTEDAEKWVLAAHVAIAKAEGKE